MLVVEADSSNARPGSVQPRVVVEAFGVDIAERQVRQVQIVRTPGRSVVACTAVLCLPEKYQLETVAMAVRTV